MALFLRYCAVCNQTSTMAGGGKCPECGGALASVAAHSLIERLGHLGDQAQREEAVAHATSDDLAERSDPGRST